ncbi:MAG: glycosyltransferase [Patescibacteria group bacterium]|nr:glycosyltransferase [Patescibacteria group bacterium]
MVRASIITATYNGEKYLRKTIESLLDQSEKDLELLIIDSDSEDGTVNLVKSYSDKRIKLYSHENTGGPAAPRNTGIAEAKGDFIGFCDQDDLYYPEKIEKQINAYKECEKKDKVGIIISSADLIDESGKIIDHNIKPFEGFMDSKSAHDLLLKGDVITACSALVPKKVLDEVGYLDETLIGVDDYDLWLRISEKYGILTIKEPLCAWRQSASSLSANKTKQYIETEKIFQKLKDETEEIRVGHGKNLMRIFISMVLDRNLNEAKEYRDKIREYPVSKKMKMLIKTFDLSRNLSYYQLCFLKKVGKVSL